MDNCATLVRWQSARFAPGPEGGLSKGASLRLVADVALRESVAVSRPPWGAGSGANRIGKRSGGTHVASRCTLGERI